MKKTKKRVLSFITSFLLTSNLLFGIGFYTPKAAEGEVNLKVNKLVDKESVYTGEEFTYTLQYANPSTTTDANNVVLIDELPSNIKYVANTPSLDVESVKVENVNGHDVVKFIFKSPLKAGKSGIVKITAKFPEGVTPATIDGKPNLAINSAKIKPSNGSEVVSNVVNVTPMLKAPDWSVSKTKTVPSSTPAIGQPVTYEVRINSNSLVGELNLRDINIVDTIPLDATYVSSTNGGKYNEEKDANNNIIKKTVTWTIDNLEVGKSSTRYITLLYPEKNNGVGYDTSSTVTNIADAKVKLLDSDDILTKQATASHGFTTATYGAGNFLKSGRQADDRYSVGQTANFYLSNIQNTGNVPLENIAIEDTIPNEIKLTSITTGSYNSSVDLKVYYKTNLSNTEWIPWSQGDYNSPNNSTLKVEALNLQGEECVTNVKWMITNEAQGIPAGFRETSAIHINGVVSMPLIGNTITNNSSLTANESLPNALVKNSSKTISVIDSMPWLVPSKTIKNGQIVYNMNDYVEYKLVIKNHDYATGDYHNPIGVDVVPKDLQDIEFTGWDKGNSSITDAPITDNTRTINTGTQNQQQLLTWKFNGTLKPGEYVEVYYRAKIVDKALAGQKTNDFYITSDVDSIYENPASEQIVDTNDLDGDDSKSDKFIKATNDIFVKFIGSIEAQKWVKGELDDKWNYYSAEGEYGKTLPGGISNYRLVVKNDGANGPISNIVLIDILPFKGDMGVIDLSPRESGWRPYLVNKITGEDGKPEPAGIKVYYSTNANPSKEELYDPINKRGQPSDGWSETPPEDITSVKSLKFDFGDIALKPNETITLEWPMRAPYGVPEEEIMWNSFGYAASYPDVNGPQAFLPSEPKKVGFKVETHPNAEYNLGNYVWEDINKNGIQDDGETGIDGVLVNLYRHGESEPFRYTRTGLSYNGKAGYYLFPKLAPGHYDVEFVFPKDYKATLPKSLFGADATDSDISNVGYTSTNYNDNGTSKYSVKVTDVVINNGDNLDLDAGLYKTASIGDYLWKDENRNGIQDNGERGIDGVKVLLLDENGNRAKDDDGNDIPELITKDGGKFSFTNLSPGVKYKVRFMNPDRYYKFTDALKGADSSKDSDGVSSNDEITIGDGLGDIYATTADIVLKSGENNTSIDQGMYLAEIGDYVWHDLNANGKQEAGEPGISGVTVTLTDNTGKPVTDAYGVTVAPVITDSNGKYLFRDLKPGIYKVKFTRPAGYDKLSIKDTTTNGTTDATDSDANRDTGVTDEITIKAGDRNFDVDAGLYKLVSLGDFVWNDLNGNGKQDIGEPGIDGVTVNLLYDNGDAVLDGSNNAITTTTSGGGLYKFENLDPGKYIVQFINPNDEFVFTTKNKTGTGYTTANDSNVNNTGVNKGKTDIITINSGAGYNNTIDAGMYKAALGNYVWEDINGNGIQDDGNKGINGVTVNLYKESDLANAFKTVVTANDSSNNPGYYEFNDLDSGNYIVEFILPSGTKFITKNASGSTNSNNSDADETTGRTDIISLDKGERDLTIDAGVYYPASIGDYLWEDKNGNGVQDAGEKGINGSTVYLYKQGNPIPIRSMITKDNNGSAGYFLFNDLVPGNYCLQFDLPAGYDTFTFKDKGSGVNQDKLDSDVYNSGVNFGKTDYTFLNSKEKDDTFDAGVYNYVTLGDKVWRDTNINGLQDAGELGLSNVTVNLYKFNGTSYVAKAFTKTDSHGNYLFDRSFKLEPGQYKLEFIKPEGYAFTSKGIGADNSVDSDAALANGETVAINLSSGQNDITWDAGLYKLASLGDYVWDDKNVNGIQDVGETGISNVTVKLYDKNNNLVKTTTTNVLGNYSFTDIVPGDYYLNFSLPSHYALTDMNKGGNNGADSDVDAKTLKTRIFTLAEGEEDLTWDMGLYRTSSMGDYVFEDMNANGIQDNGDKPIKNIVVNLLDSNGNFIKATVTDSNGKYLFEDLQKGDYFIEFVKGDYIFTSKSSGGDPTLDSDANNLGRSDKIILSVDEHRTDIDAGLYKPASLGDYVWLDKNNDGKQDVNEPGIGGIKVNLLDKDGNVVKDSSNNPITATTDANGKYSFTNLVPGDYVVEFISAKSYYKLTTANASDNSTDSDAAVDMDGNRNSGKTHKITLVSGESNGTIDAGFTVKTSISIEKTVYAGHDGGKRTGEELVVGEKGTPVTYLFKVTNTGDTYLKDVSIDDTILGIDKSKMIKISGEDLLAPGASLVYYYETSINGDLINTASTTGTPSDNTGMLVSNIAKPVDEDTAMVDEVKPDIDVQKTIYLGRYSEESKQEEIVSGKNGEWVTYIFTVTNTGDTYLKDLDLYDVTLGIDKSKMTKISGEDLLAPGAKAVFYYETTINGDLTNTVKVTGTPTDNNGNELPNTKKPVDEDIANAKALGSIGDYLWYDNNGDGKQDLGEPALSAVTLRLLDKDGNEVMQAITDSNGKYIFDRLVPGEYTVVVDKTTLPEGLKETYELDNTLDGSVKVNLTPGQVIVTVDFGYYKLGKLGDYVWEDTNGNGVQEAEEKGIKDVTVNLYTARGDLVKTTTTDENGLYKFEDLTLGDYYIEFVKPEGFEFTKENSVEDANIDSDVNANARTSKITVMAAAEDMSYDAGLYRPASIGDYLWYDNNGDGKQDLGEPALSGVTLNLLDKDGNVLLKAVTDSNGKYIFDKLIPGEYTVVVDKTTLPEGLKETYELDNTLDGSVKVTLAPGQNVDTVDFGYYKLGKLGDYVWEDTNGNGVQDPGEKGIKDVTVNLYTAQGDLVKTTTTDENGLYKFQDLTLGDYYIEFVKPQGFEFTKENSVEDANIDSDADTNGRTSMITIMAATEDMSYDAGLYRLASMGDYVWLDKNGNGKQDSNEPGISGIKVSLLDKDGNAVKDSEGNPVTIITDESGEYVFTNLVPGEYSVEFSSSKGCYKLTAVNVGDDNLDSDVEFAIDANRNSGMTAKVTLLSGENNISIDAGFTVKASISIEKTVYAGHNGGKGIGTELVVGEKGTPVTYLFKVTNTGGTYLKDVEINDVTLGIDKNRLTKISGEDLLAPGESLLYYYETSINGDLINIVETTGTPTDNLGIVIPNVDKPLAEDTANTKSIDNKDKNKDKDGNSSTTLPKTGTNAGNSLNLLGIILISLGVLFAIDFNKKKLN